MPQVFKSEHYLDLHMERHHMSEVRCWWLHIFATVLQLSVKSEVMQGSYLCPCELYISMCIWHQHVFLVEARLELPLHLQPWLSINQKLSGATGDNHRHHGASSVGRWGLSSWNIKWKPIASCSCLSNLGYHEHNIILWLNQRALFYWLIYRIWNLQKLTKQIGAILFGDWWGLFFFLLDWCPWLKPKKWNKTNTKQFAQFGNKKKRIIFFLV